MNLLLLADSTVGSEILDFLLDRFPDDLGVVVTIEENAIYEKARNSGIEVEIFRDSHTLYEKFALRSEVFDLGLLAWWPKIIKPPLIEFPAQSFINFHPSLLPHNRGKHYNFWALVEEASFGVTLHFIDEGIDTGEIVAQREILYDWTDTGQSLFEKAQKEIVQLFCNEYPKIRTLSIPRKAQDLSEGSYHSADELEKASRIDLDNQYRGRDILNLLRARTFTGYPACCFEDNGELFEVRVEIKRKR